MKNSLKVAKWEIKRNMTNKSFIISIILTPIIFAFFIILPSLFGGGEDGEELNMYVLDEVGVFDKLDELASAYQLEWNLEKTDLPESEIAGKVKKEENTAYLTLTKEGLEKGEIPLYKSEDVSSNVLFEASVLEEPLRQYRIEGLSIPEEQKAVLINGVTIQLAQTDEPAGEEAESGFVGEDTLKRAAPGIFAGIILFSIVMTGMMIFTSASQEKKEKVAEIILSSITPVELMQGKILGYFVLGIIQVAVTLVFVIPLVIWKSGLPLLSYVLVPRLALLLFIALAGYLLFAAVFVALGATVEDMTSTSNFQSLVIMLPFLPVLFAGPLFENPDGLIAKIGTFIPFTSPAILIFRLSMLETWPWTEILIALAVLLISIWFIMKLAGKIFKVGILMYGKNATPKEIWKWIRA